MTNQERSAKVIQRFVDAGCVRPYTAAVCRAMGYDNDACRAGVCPLFEVCDGDVDTKERKARQLVESGFEIC